MTRSKRILLVACGTASVAVGIVGIAIPLVPTTPFLLLAAYLYARSSERLHSWLLWNRVFGGYLRRYIDGRQMSRRDKAITLLLLWSTLSVTLCWAVESWWIRGALVVMGAAVSAHILRLSSRCDIAGPGADGVSAGRP